MPKLQTLVAYVERHGLRYTLRRSWEKLSEQYFGTYDRVWKVLAPTAAEGSFQREHQPEAGLISVVIPVYNPKPQFVEELCASLMAQSYQNWEAVFYNAGDNQAVRDTLDRAAREDQRIHVTHSSINEGISGNTNRAIAMAQGEWIALCDHDDLLTPDALWRVARCIVQEQPDLIYTDEDKITEDGRHYTDPHMKPDYCPDNLLSSNYICHLLVIRRTLLDEVGGENSDFDGSQDHDLALRCAEKAQKIAHIRAVCYHWRTVGASMSHQHLDQCLQASCCAAQESMRRTGYAGTVTPNMGVARLNYPPPEGKSLCVILTGKGKQPELSWNGSLRWTQVENPLDFAAINQAVTEATEDFICLLSSEVCGFSADFLPALAAFAQREHCGAVSPLLLDRQGRVTHMGYALCGKRLAVPRSPGIKASAGGWHELTRQTHHVGAVSLACLMIRRDHWLPLPESYHSALAVVTWCVEISRKTGLWHTVTPNATAVCTQWDLLLAGKERDEGDVTRFQKQYPDYRDPCWHPLFREERGDYRLKDIHGLSQYRQQERKEWGMNP